MKAYLYLTPRQLDVLRHARLHFLAVSEQPDPWQLNARMISRQRVGVSEGEFQKELERQFKALPDQLKGLMTWDAFQKEAVKKRPKIEAQMKKRKQGKPPALPNPKAYDDLGFCRFFTTADNPLLWERYADQHRGIVLEFNTDYPKFNTNKQVLKPVVYSKKRPTADHPMKPFPALFHRAAEYASEEEVRLVRPLSEAKDCKTMSNGQQVYFYPFPPRSLVSVTLGVNIAAETREQVERILTYDLKYKPGRTLREVLLDPDEYKLHLRGTL
ncbi:Protein of unknown function [Marinospirillum celere]|uniref:DUF2971 domain-containing protein n=1 Tax=Marinospirillum celere TaxID=1122252 RepID=A0A1I1H1P4_9GAMM|nr:DUF2971 domain-containing protein [Marinospirillum celere]SFC17844.1 Protein of unknown function [Marinospirillum celere]